MKNFKIIYKFFLLSFIYPISCTDLTDVAEDAISTNGPADGGTLDPNAVLSGAYDALNPLVGQGDWYGLSEGSSDELTVPTRGTDWSDFGVWRQLHQHTWDPFHSFVLNGWNVLNTGNFRAQQAIQISQDKPELKTTIQAPARFLRALFYYWIVDLYGQVPYRKNLNDPNEVPSVYTRKEATDVIIKDLEFAIANLPSIGGAVKFNRATKEAAQFLLAKVYLNKAVFTAENPAGPYTFAPADMAKVVELADAVAGKFSLSEYWNNFIPENGTKSTELVFGIENNLGDPIANTWTRMYNTLHYSQGGWNGFSTLADFYNKWEQPIQAGDVRKNASIPGITDKNGIQGGFLIGQQFNAKGEPLKDRAGNPLVYTKELDLLYSNEVNGVRVIKYLPAWNNPDTEVNEAERNDNDYIIFRYADLVLMKAEALLRSGDAGGALSVVNALRTNRGAQPLASLTEQLLLDERGFELYWEGWRRNDQIRFGTFLEEGIEKPVSQPTAVLYPIPQRAVDTNPNLKQNPGY